MKRILIAILFTSIFATVALAQEPPPMPEDNILIRRQGVFQGPEVPPPPPPPGSNVIFMASESFGGKIVKGAPYSAEAVTETIQTLADGNRIVNKMTSAVYRDSEGRTRREHTLKGLGALGTGEEPLQTIFIQDPVAGVTYSLDSRTRTAHKSAPFKFELTTKPGAEGKHFEFKVGRGASAGAATNVFVPGPHGAGTEIATAGNTYVFKTRTAHPGNELKEDLGKQLIEGVEAEGTRTTVTIPAGEIGNDRPIEIVSERWYSPELQLVVMTRHSDPRSGETTYKLTNINRTEPARSLFEVPSGYTLKEMHRGAIAAPRVKKTHPE